MSCNAELCQKIEEEYVTVVFYDLRRHVLAPVTN